MQTIPNWTAKDLRLLTNAVPALISYFDSDHVCRFANDYHRRWYGRAPGDLVGRHMREFLGEEGYALRAPYLARVAEGEQVAFDAQVPHLDGTPRDASIRYVPSMGQDGFEGFHILVFDTALHQHRFKSVFDGTAVAFWEVDMLPAQAMLSRGGSIREALDATLTLDCNSKAAGLLGFDRDRIIGRPAGMFWPPASEPVFEALLGALGAGHPSFEAETQLLRADGTALPVLCACAFPVIGQGECRIALGLVDLTERIAREQALGHLQAELAHAARVAVLGELTASIAHEVNQPLGAVVNNGNAALRWLNRDEPKLSEVRVSLERVVAEAKRAAEIIARIRALAVRGVSERVDLDPALLVRESVALVERQLADQNVTLRSIVAEGLPAISGDRIQLQQVLVNLLINAAQAMAGQAVPALIEIAVGHDPDAILFSVEDSGPGFDDDQATGIFNAFYTTKPAGMGIGLSISKTIVEGHGGAIRAMRAPGGGARFIFTIPSAHHDG